jgi:hypothetical protein
MPSVRDDQASAPVAAVRDHRRPADGDDEAGVSVDDDPVILALLQGWRRPDVDDEAVCRGDRHPEGRGELAQRQVGSSAGGDRQRPGPPQQAPGQALADRVRAFAPQRREWLAELTRTQPGERADPAAPAISVIRAVSSAGHPGRRPPGRHPTPAPERWVVLRRAYSGRRRGSYRSAAASRKPRRPCRPAGCPGPQGRRDRGCRA